MALHGPFLTTLFKDGTHARDRLFFLEFQGFLDLKRHPVADPVFHSGTSPRAAPRGPNSGINL
jgi:hypothetical protein